MNRLEVDFCVVGAGFVLLNAPRDRVEERSRRSVARRPRVGEEVLERIMELAHGPLGGNRHDRRSALAINHYLVHEIF